MPNYMVPTNGNSVLPAREERSLTRTLNRMEGRQLVARAAIQYEAELQVDRIQAVGYVGQQGMQVVAMTSQLEANLSTLVPAATTRLQALADIASLEVADLVSQTVRRVCR